QELEKNMVDLKDSKPLQANPSQGQRNWPNNTQEYLMDSVVTGSAFFNGLKKEEMEENYDTVDLDETMLDFLNELKGAKDVDRFVNRREPSEGINKKKTEQGFLASIIEEKSSSLLGSSILDSQEDIPPPQPKAYNPFETEDD